MNLAYFAALLLVFWLLAMLYVGPTYFRRLGALIERLENQHATEYERLGRPSLNPLQMNIGSTYALVRFVLSKDYQQLSDSEVTRLGNAARSRLLFSLSGILLVLLIMFLSPTQA